MSDQILAALETALAEIRFYINNHPGGSSGNQAVCAKTAINQLETAITERKMENTGDIKVVLTRQIRLLEKSIVSLSY